jgi:hypothetical protein
MALSCGLPEDIFLSSLSVCRLAVEIRQLITSSGEDMVKAEARLLDSPVALSGLGRSQYEFLRLKVIHTMPRLEDRNHPCYRLYMPQGITSASAVDTQRRHAGLTYPSGKLNLAECDKATGTHCYPLGGDHDRSSDE